MTNRIDEQIKNIKKMIGSDKSSDQLAKELGEASMVIGGTKEEMQEVMKKTAMAITDALSEDFKAPEVTIKIDRKAYCYYSLIKNMEPLINITSEELLKECLELGMSKICGGMANSMNKIIEGSKGGE